jgi:sulfite reductase alpha subunit-like flavoprotein
VNCLYCGHVYVAHELEENKDKLNSVFEVGKCLIMACNCTSYVDKIEKIDEELL